MKTILWKKKNYFYCIITLYVLSSPILAVYVETISEESIFSWSSGKRGQYASICGPIRRAQFSLRSNYDVCLLSAIINVFSVFIGDFYNLRCTSKQWKIRLNVWWLKILQKTVSLWKIIHSRKKLKC